MAAATVTSERQFRRHDFWRALLLTVLCGLQLLPLLMAFFISFKTIPQFSRVPFLPTFPLHWENYLSAWEIVRLFLFNTVFVSGLTVVGVLALGSLAAYSFAILRYPGREFLFYLVLALMMVPATLTLIPSFVLVKNLQLLNTRWSLILPWIASGQVFAIFILRTYLQSLPGELFDAARIDGTSEWQGYFMIALPMSKSMLGVAAILNILGTWNNLIWPALTISHLERQTLTPGLWSYQVENFTRYGFLMAGLLIGSIPLIVLFFFTSRWFVEGLTSGAIKV
ncbi:MAG: carbohydrate ABC transporter permease [Caldilineaceae bacterium SB0662_bin_9]|uniref:Carbohydrate ABC transporter permease n=1 Tax=Caldilineaceae bacterium SB0662_bin_9 TaxID=2605258 RepID=A0A6B1DRM3_9CHLR|nr:carbohydrate ABC transporter permease [Caldilineaceae bacterium]MYD89831.1 carbohydrate ABC transporter permease [Caldilineaceae bacterium SB0662_bin_9]